MVEADLMAAFLTDPLGQIMSLIFLAGTIYKAWQANGLGGALEAATGSLKNMKLFMSRSSTMVTVPEEMEDTPDAWRMSDPVWKIISANLGDVERAKLRNVIDQNEGAVPPVSCYDLATSKGTFTILNGAIDDIKALDVITTSTTVDPGSGEIFRVWGGAGNSASNVPKRQPSEIDMGMASRSLYVSVKPVDVGGVTLGIFADGQLIAKKICDFQANDMDQAQNDISFPTYDFLIPKEVVHEAQETDGVFDLVVAMAKGGKWYFQSDESIIPWEGSISMKVTIE